MKNRCRIVFPFTLLLLYSTSAGLPQAERNVPRGEIVERMYCRQDAAQSYALYLPSYYDSKVLWPILYALDPGARGAVPVERFREAAEKYGYILVGSNNSRNGPVKIVQDAMNALFIDTRSRFSVNPARIYVAGFSGGARAAVQVGLAMKGKIAGILAFGAGFPPDMPPAAPIPFAMYLSAGDEDFNFPELRELDHSLEQLLTPHLFEPFSGGHEWPPETVCTHAMEWLELQAMKSGIRDKHSQVIDEIYGETVKEAGALEHERLLYKSFERYSFALRCFSGLRDVTELESAIKRLSQTEDIRRSRAMEKEIETRQKAADRELLGLFHALIAGSERQFAAQKLRAELDRLRENAGQKKDEVRRLSATRSMTRFWIMLNEEVSAALERRDHASAAVRLELMSRIRPDSPQIYYHLAYSYGITGRRKEAIESLRRAVAKGFKDVAVLENNPDFESLRNMPEYQNIVEGLKRR